MYAVFQIFAFVNTLVVVLSAGCPTTPDVYDADVLILGAGMAGITAAKTLHDKNIKNFIILEARDRIGGRMRSEEFGGFVVEVGANWIQGVEVNGARAFPSVNPIWDLRTRCGGGLQGNFSDFDSIIVRDTEGTNKREEALRQWDMLEEAKEAATMESLRRQREGMSDKSVRSSLRANKWTVNTAVKSFVDWFGWDFCFAEPPENTSLFHGLPLATYEDFGSEDFFVTDKRGYESLVHCLADGINLTHSERLHLNTLVTDISWNEDCVCVRTNTTNNLCAKYAIITFSIGVLQSDEVTFNPPLPRTKKEAINKITMATHLKIFMKFNSIFWDNTEFIGNANMTRGYYPLFQPLESFGEKFPLLKNSNIMIATLTDPLATIVSKQEVSKTEEDIMQVLREMYPDKDFDLEDFLVPNWKTDPLYFGTYSNIPVGVNNETFQNLRAPLGRLYFSGEAMSKKYNGFVHGAYLEGEATASDVAAKLSSSGSQSNANTALCAWQLILALYFTHFFHSFAFDSSY